MEFILLIRDMPILVRCIFEMLIFKSSQVIKYNVMFAFLFVQTVSIHHKRDVEGHRHQGTGN